MRPMHAFIIVRGQEDNLGDSVLRRPLRKLLEEQAVVVHALVGDNSASYLSSVGLKAGDITYKSAARWATALTFHAMRSSGTRVVLNAGEMKLDDDHNYLGWKLGGPLRLALRRGCVVVQTGTGLRDTSVPAPASTAALLRRMALVNWRDAASQAVSGVGGVAPDWAFSSWAQPSRRAEHPGGRPFLVVTMRGDRESPSAEWISRVRRLALSLGLEIRVVTQVVRDSRRSRELSEWLACTEPALVWEQGETHLQLEATVREVYSQAAIVVSDRLHALIIAASEGAVPVGLTTGSAAKLTRTLAPVGLDHLCGTVDQFASIESAAREMTQSPAVLEAKMAAAEESLRNVAQDVRRALGGKAPTLG